MTDLTPSPPASSPTPTRAAHAAPQNSRRAPILVGAVVVAAVVLLIVLLASRHSSPSGGGAHVSAAQRTQLMKANSTVLTQIGQYTAAAKACQSNAHPITCVQAADRKAGDEIHVYANSLTTHNTSGIPHKDTSAALNNAQASANSLEILGDSAPTAAGYKKTLGEFNITDALNQLQKAVNQLNGDL